ncbi:MAG: 16S rRNA (adenine(1518)-N(6)/adenine(1519)-N(6))-dimethyltransferase RsmA [Thermoanaerobaculia bacterium]
MPKKEYAQHFLKDKYYIKKIIGALGAKEGERILEIGPGRGSLTYPMLKEGFFVIAIEKDRELESYLKGENLKLYFEDATIFPSDLEEFLKENRIKYVISNLPYNVGTRIYLRYLPYLKNLERMVLMFQEEVGEKIMAGAGSSSYGALSVITQTCSMVEKICRVPPSSFYPKPEVYSVVLSFKGKEVSPAEFDPFFSFLNKCFKHPRKTLYNNLLEFFSKNIIKSMFENLELDFKIRPHQIAPEGFSGIYNFFKGEKCLF